MAQRWKAPRPTIVTVAVARSSPTRLAVAAHHATIVALHFPLGVFGTEQQRGEGILLHPDQHDAVADGRRSDLRGL